MAGNKEKNFASAVVYVKNDAVRIGGFLKRLYGILEENFEKYEVICVNDNSADGSGDAMRAFVRQERPQRPLTIVNLSIGQGVELAMNAGLDLAIGDFVFEFDRPEMEYPEGMVMESYRTALTGFDIVSVGPRHTPKLASRLFYSVFNRYSKSQYRLGTDVFRLVSRRAIHRVHAVNPTLVYRKAAYAASGLKLQQLFYDAPAGRAPGQARGYRTDLAFDSLALYTDAAYKFSLAVSLVFLALTLFSGIYTVVIYFSRAHIEGWTTTMLLLSGGFFGAFLVLTIVVKYLSLLVDLVFRRQKYLVESVEKLQGDEG